MIGKNIAFYRKLSKKKQSDLAEVIGKTSGYISMLETGKSTITDENLKLIANFLGVTIDDLKNDDENITSKSLLTTIKKLTINEKITWSQMTIEGIQKTGIFNEFIDKEKNILLKNFNAYRSESKLKDIYFLTYEDQNQAGLFSLFSVGKNDESFAYIRICDSNNVAFKSDLEELYNAVSNDLQDKKALESRLKDAMLLLGD